MNLVDIFVRTPNGVPTALGVETSWTVADIKDLIAATLNIDAHRQRLVYSGRVLRNHRSLDEYGIVPGATVDLVVLPASGS